MDTVTKWRALTLAIFVFAAVVAAEAQDTFQTGDILVSLSNGSVQWYRLPNTAAPLHTLTSGITGQAKGMAFNSGNELFVAHWWMVDANGSPVLGNGNTVAHWTNTGTFMGQWGPSLYNCNPEAVLFNNTGFGFVGLTDCDMDVLKLDVTGNLVSTFNTAVNTSAGERGSGFLDLAADQCTLFYTSRSLAVKRFNVCTGTQMADFASLPGTAGVDQAHGIRVLSDGGVLVAAMGAIRRLNASGAVIDTFDAPNSNCWISVDLDNNNRYFWGLDYCTGMVSKFDLTNHNVVTSFSPAGTLGANVAGAVHVKQIKVVGGRVIASAKRWMTGGGSLFTGGERNGTRVTHGFVLPCPGTDHPGPNLQINWEGNSFHLTSLTTAECTNAANISAGKPDATFDTYHGTGTGRFNGQDGYFIDFTFTDAGEPGRTDTGTITIRQGSATGAVVLQVNVTELRMGNHQAHEN